MKGQGDNKTDKWHCAQGDRGERKERGIPLTKNSSLNNRRWWQGIIIPGREEDVVSSSLLIKVYVRHSGNSLYSTSLKLE